MKTKLTPILIALFCTACVAGDKPINIKAYKRTALITNESFVAEKKWVQVPCPDKMIGCLVLHSEAVEDKDSKTRTRVVEVSEVSYVDIPLLSITNETSRKTLSKKRIMQRLDWIDIGEETNVTVSRNFYATNFSNIPFIPWITNYFLTNIGAWTNNR